MCCQNIKKMHFFYFNKFTEKSIKTFKGALSRNVKDLPSDLGAPYKSLHSCNSAKRRTNKRHRSHNLGGGDEKTSSHIIGGNISSRLSVLSLNAQRSPRTQEGTYIHTSRDLPVISVSCDAKAEYWQKKKEKSLISGLELSHHYRPAPSAPESLWLPPGPLTALMTVKEEKSLF